MCRFCIEGGKEGGSEGGTGEMGVGACGLDCSRLGRGGISRGRSCMNFDGDCTLSCHRWTNRHMLGRFCNSIPVRSLRDISSHCS